MFYTEFESTPGENLCRIFKDLQRSFKICKVPVKILENKDLFRIFKDPKGFKKDLLKIL